MATLISEECDIASRRDSLLLVYVPGYMLNQQVYCAMKLDTTWNRFNATNKRSDWSEGVDSVGLRLLPDLTNNCLLTKKKKDFFFQFVSYTV